LSIGLTVFLAASAAVVLASAAPAYADYPTITVRVTSVAGPTGSNAFATATVSCNQDETLVGGGGFAQPPAGSQNPSPLHLNGSFPSDAAGNPVSGTASTAGSWTAIAEEGGSVGTGTTTGAYAMCAADGDGLTAQMVAATTPGPSTAGTVTATADCPDGTYLLGGGAYAQPPAGSPNPSPLHLNGSFPSDAAGNPVSGTASTAGSWSAAASSGSALGSGTTTSAYAVCTDVAGSVVSTYVGFHGVSGPSTSGAFATATATPCLHHWGDELISGGALTTAAGGQNAAPLHLNGSVPSDSSGDPLSDGSSGTFSWTGVAESGTSLTGVTTTAYAVCAQIQ
jgi:hypothetical protein